MKTWKISMVALAVVAAMAGCGGPSQQTVCEDACNAAYTCAAAIVASISTGGGSSGSTGTTAGNDCSTTCANASSSSSSSCKSLGNYDTCVKGVNASDASTCSSDITACETNNC